MFFVLRNTLAQQYYAGEASADSRGPTQVLTADLQQARLYKVVLGENSTLAVSPALPHGITPDVWALTPVIAHLL